MAAIHNKHLIEVSWKIWTFPYISFTFWGYGQFHIYHPALFPYIIILISTSIITPLVQDKPKYYMKIFHSDRE